ncbi:putative phosphoesterase [Indibacter alkaliphilus LW1]|uniref:Phosphoesterase n=1 Tax=Indibacter alkaliphilus (strain CCUG 57479 / KCTC 22604 / LW1) TaxID=1189612 RepID=S2DEU6_INDAL|nr:metallophosphoesterase [Indibacter alkaliphilus]EOZ95525.1 putative phosphoesterase [Indibacter alkaliphilus LW1]
MNNLGSLIFLASVLLFTTFLNWYVFQAVKTLTSNLDSDKIRNSINVGYWLIFSGISLWVILTFIGIFSAGEISATRQTALNVFLTVLVTQLVIVLILFGEDIFRNLQAGFSLVANGSKDFTFPTRNAYVSTLAIAIAAFPFFSFIYGTTYGKYNFKVHKEVIYFENLPDAFDGFTITQLSDIHSGSLRDKEGVRKGVDLAVRQNSDLVVFTGDLVNHKAEEIDPFLEQFAEIKGKYGQFSILGNHDYGDYISWPSKSDKEQNLENLKAKHAEMGFRLLLDEHVRIEKDGQEITLIGVENWGVGFVKKGDLSKAMEGTPEDGFKVLLSHDPSHWDEEVKKNQNPVHLTLSGHTHGMQFGIETPLVRWSPVQYRYPNWAGLAEEKGRFLYVNRGFGFHAFSGRVGIWPEITVIELRKAN